MLGEDSGSIAVTGMGAVSPLGLNLKDSWRSCRNGKSAIKMTSIYAGECGPPECFLPVAVVPENPTAGLEARLGRKIGMPLDPFSLYALSAAAEALSESGLTPEHLRQAAIVLGHGMCGASTLETCYARFYGDRTARVNPMTIPKVMMSAPAGAVAMTFGVRGPVFGVSSACASSGHAIAQGAMLIRAGLADVAIVGGSEAIVTPTGLAAWAGIRAMSSTLCRPFSAGRDGMSIGEGAAVMVLESAAHARKRGAPIFAMLAGIGMSSDAGHWTQPSLDGAVGCMRMACEQAGILNDGPVLISAHGTGTPLNDRNEAEAIKAVFGERHMDHPVIATKSAHGHLIGGATVLQAVLGLCALRDRVAPPILNYLGPDPECALNLVLDEAQPIDCKALLVNAFAFGGLNASIVLRAADGGA